MWLLYLFSPLKKPPVWIHNLIDAHYESIIIIVTFNFYKFLVLSLIYLYGSQRSFNFRVIIANIFKRNKTKHNRSFSFKYFKLVKSSLARWHIWRASVVASRFITASLRLIVFKEEVTYTPVSTYLYIFQPP